MSAINTITSTPANGAAFAYIGIAVMLHDGTLYTDLNTAWTAHTYLGAIDAAGYTTTLPGAPTRDAVQVGINGGVEFLAAYTASTDPASLAGTFREFLREEVWENLLGLDLTSGYAYSDGGLNPFVSAIAVACDEAMDPIIGWHLPYSQGYVNGDITQAVGGTDGIGSVAGKFDGSTDPISGMKYGLFLPSGH